MIKWFKSRIELLNNDKELLKIFLMHLLLIGLHIYENYVGAVEYHWYLRAGGCAVISLCIFLFGRQGLSYGLIIFSCTLVYINNFYNYATIFFILIAMGANPKIKNIAPWIYLINVVISFTLKRLGIIPFLIHVTYIFMFYTKINYVFAVNKPKVLNLTDSEKAILLELAKGKQQKEIDLFSQNTITKHLRNAQERNFCKSKTELLSKYMHENKNSLAIQSQG